MLDIGVTYEELLARLKKGQRNGNGRKLNFLGKVLYRASLWYTRHLGSIVNEKLVEKLLALVKRFKETKSMKIFRRGFKKAVELLEKGGENGAFTWAYQLRDWLRDSNYIFWLGTVQ